MERGNQLVPGANGPRPRRPQRTKRVHRASPTANPAGRKETERCRQTRFTCHVCACAGVLLACCLTVLALLSATAMAGTGGTGGTGGPEPTVTGSKAKLRHGLAIAPEKAPWRVKRVIAAANKIAKGHGYCDGGGVLELEVPLLRLLERGQLCAPRRPPDQAGDAAAQPDALGQARAREVDLRLRQFRSRVDEDRRAAIRHRRYAWRRARLGKGMVRESSQSYATRHRSRFSRRYSF